MNPHFRDMLSALCAEGAEFLLVGAYAMAAHGLPRATGDLDIWIRPTDDNAPRVWRALERFKAPLSNLSIDDLKTTDVVYQIGVAPSRIDLLTSISDVEFEAAWKNRKHTKLAGFEVGVLSRADLLRNKRASGRPKDLADAAWLESEHAK